MYCPNCGKNMEDGSKFCSNCGKALKMNESSVGGTIQLRCKSCNGIMNVKEDESILYCPYCGAEEMMIDSEDVAKEKIRYKAYADVEKHRQDTTRQVEMERMKHEKEMKEHEEIKESAQQFKQSKLRKWVIVFAVLCALLTYSSFSDGHYLGGLIAGVQTVLFLAAWILGMGTSKKHWLYRLCAILGFLLIIPFISYGQDGGGGSRRANSKLEWPSTGLAAMLPEPDSKYGKVISNSSDYLSIDVERYSTSQFEDYISQCKDLGFTIEGKKSSSGYDSFNDEGYDLSLQYYDLRQGEMSISLRSPIEMANITWPDFGPGALLPAPKSLKGKIYRESSTEFNVYIGDTTKEDFNEYINQCKARGFTENYNKSDEKYEAENSDGYQLSIYYEGFNIIEIRIEAPEEADLSSKSSSSSNADIAVPTETPVPTDTPIPVDTPSSLDDSLSIEEVSSVPGIGREFKEFVDSYEAFYDEYVEFLSTYDSSDFSMLAQYTEMMSRLAEFDQKAEAYQDDSDLTPEELKYFMDANARIEQKLLSVE